DDNGYDGFKLLEEPAIGCGRAELHHLTSCKDGRAECREHEHQDLYAVHRDTDVAGGLCVSARCKDPVAEACPCEKDVRESDQHQGPDYEHRHALDDRLPGARTCHELADET